MTDQSSRTDQRSRTDRHRIAAGIVVLGEFVLLCRRRDDRPWYPGVWDLPGGHVADGESAAQALARECTEELGVAILDPQRLIGYHEPDMEMTVFVVTAWRGEVVNAATQEHSHIGWFTADQIARLPLSDARLGSLLRDVLGDADTALRRSRGQAGLRLTTASARPGFDGRQTT